MPRIEKYNIDTTVSGADKVIGTDSTTGKTKNFTLSDIAKFQRGNLL